MDLLKCIWVGASLSALWKRRFTKNNININGSLRVALEEKSGDLHRFHGICVVGVSMNVLTVWERKCQGGFEAVSSCYT